jgi:group I intron endonuclease
MKGIVYKIENLINGKKYIGQTSRDMFVRFQEHCSLNNKTCSKLKNSIKKYGKDCFYMEALWESENCTQEEINEKEMEMIKKYNTMSPNGYNLTEGGLGGRHSDETKQILSKISKKMWSEKREEMVEKRKLQWTAERKAKLSETLKQLYIERPEMRIKHFSTSTCSRTFCM